MERERLLVKIDGQGYEVPWDGRNTPSLILLPDGRLVRPTGWLETYPPQLGGYKFVNVAKAVLVKQY